MIYMYIVGLVIITSMIIFFKGRLDDLERIAEFENADAIFSRYKGYTLTSWFSSIAINVILLIYKFYMYDEEANSTYTAMVGGLLNLFVPIAIFIFTISSIWGGMFFSKNE